MSDYNNSSYVSCIKVDGFPILPPLIDTEKAKELLKYKNEAVKIEKRLKCEKKLREHIKNYYSTNCSSDVLTKTVESNLAHLDMHFDKNNETYEAPVSLPSQDINIQNSRPRNNSLDLGTHKALLDCDNENFEKAQELKNHPPLIRSNSYTLESPSPLLIECLQKKGELESAFNVNNSQINSSELTQLGRNENIALLKSDLQSNNLPQKNFENINSSPEKDSFGTEVSLPLVNKRDDYSILESQNSPKNLAIIQPDAHTKIVELLDTYKKQQQQRLESYARLKGSLLGDINEILSPTFKNKIQNKNKSSENSISDKNLLDSFRSSDNSISSETICLTDTSSSDQTNIEPKTDLLIDFNDNNQHISKKCVGYSTAPNYNDLCVLDLFPVSDNSNKQKPFNRKLFNSLDKDHKKMIQEKAAIVICSAARGFLVRRLMKTERVQTLIQTIKDALLCAIELHMESVDKIRPADVELHRRLIQQVTAACHDFYDIFFSLTKKEQMSLIAIDRHKKRIKKPLLTPNLRKTAKIKNQVITSRYKRSINNY